MNGAESLVRSLAASGIEVCFTNPGTSEMHFMAALDQTNALRCILGLQENVVTGAADGYGRMAEKPAATLLHLGPGLGNGLANLHNASKAGTGIVNIVGDHATYHVEYNAPLTADIEGIARPVSQWIKTSPTAKDIAADGAFSAGMLACFEPTLAAHGATCYPQLYWETGALGQVLYLEAEAIGIRSTGIGCFFDDSTHRVAEMKGHTFQDLYHFTLGGPVDDDRLVTRPPYAHLGET